MSKSSDLAVALVAAQVSGSTDALRAAVLFEVVSEFCRDVIQTVPPSDYMTDPGGWLSDANWLEHHTTIISGTLARLYVMPNKPWSNIPVAQAHAELYRQGATRGGAIVAAKETANSTLERIKAIVRVFMPNVRDPVFYESLFLVADAFSRDVSQTTPPVQTDTADKWLTETLYIENMNLIKDGVMAHLYSMIDQAWGNIEAAKLHAAMWVANAPRAREYYVTTKLADTGYSRIMMNIRMLVPQMRDPMIHQELFNVIEVLQRNVRQQAVPAYGSSPETWLSSNDYMSFYRLIMAGTLARIYSQSGKPWTDLASAAVQQGIYADEVSTIRGDAGDDAVPDPTGRIMASIRTELPSVKDAVILQALFNVMTEACRKFFVWVEVVPFTIHAGQRTFTITVPNADIIRVVSMSHPTITASMQYDPAGKIYIDQDVTDLNARSPVQIVMALAPSITVSITDPGNWVPQDLWGTLHLVLFHGVLSALMLAPAKPYSNPELAKVHGMMYRRFLVEARQEVQACGLIPAQQNWSFPRFA